MGDLRWPNRGLGLTFNRIVVAALDVWMILVTWNQKECMGIAVG